MKLLSEDGVARRFRDGHSPTPPHAEPAEGIRFRIPLPDDAVAVASLAYEITITSVPDYDEAQFGGAVLWLRRWEIWSESIDQIGYALLNGVRASAEAPKSIESAPAQEFERGEFFLACASLSLPMLFQWDAEFYLFGGTCSFRVSHEGYLDVVARDHAAYGDLLRRFERWRPEGAVTG